MTERRVPPWHIWRDKRGTTHALGEFEDGKLTNLDTGESWAPANGTELVELVATQRMYVGTTELLGLPWFNEIVAHEWSEPIVSRSAGLQSITVHRRGTASHGCIMAYKSFKVERFDWPLVREFFGAIGFEAASIPMASEKLLRSTLPGWHGISRPNISVRSRLLDGYMAGRQHEARGTWGPGRVYEYDMNRAHLLVARRIPDPTRAPEWLRKPSLDSGRPAYIHARVHCPASAEAYPGPLPLRSDGMAARYPGRGCHLSDWWWAGELRDARQAGWEIETLEGWEWAGFSSIWEMWADEIGFMIDTNEGPVRDMLKTAYTGMIGKCRMKPVRYSLVPIEEADEDDLPLTRASYEADTEWAIRAKNHPQSTALTPQGSFVFMQQRRRLYRLIRELHLRGVEIISANTDGVYLAEPLPEDMQGMLGTKEGQLKEKIHDNVRVVQLHLEVVQ